MGQGRSSYPISPGILYPAALLSGATALVYEIVWARRLALFLGNGTAAAAAVLSAFMLGLALGAFLVGSRTDSSRRPLRWYGLLELGVGFYALAFDAILDVSAGIAARQPWLFSCMVLVVPAMLMGGTLPVLARAGADSREGGTRVFGTLYGINTLGAVLGAFLATFVLMKSFGLNGAVMAAAVLNLALGVGFWVLGTRAGDRPVYEEDVEVTGGRWTGDAGLGVIVAFFLAGFGGLALEIAWFRLLVYYLEGFTIAFGLMLATYLLGLGGGALAGTMFALGSKNPRRLLARILLVQAVLAIGTFLFVTPIGDALESMRQGYKKAEGMDGTYMFGLFLSAAAVILPATICAGMLMPVVARISLSDREAIARHTGALYAATTFGAVLAPPIAGFWLLPALSVPGLIAAMAALFLVAGTVLAVSRGLREWVWAGAAAVLFVAVSLGAGLTTPMVERAHVMRAARAPRRLLEFREGQLGGVSVIEELTDGTRRLYIDGFSAAETGRHYGYMRMLGDLPVLMHPDPKRVCVIAFGTGTTAGAAAAHDTVEKVTCVEIEPAVYAVADRFKEQNRGVLDNPKVEKIVADGREFVQREPKRFDVITLEPLMPYTPAAVYLYTREFYEAARESLADGGMLCQWIPPQGVSNADLRRLVASVTAEFAHVSLWYFPHAVLVLGSDTPPRVDLDALIKRCNPEMLEDLQAALVGDVAHMLGAMVCSDAELVRALDGAEPFVDNRTDLEFRPLPRGLGKRKTIYHAENLEFLSKHYQESVPWLVGPAIAAARRTDGAVLATLAREWRLYAEQSDEHVSSDVLRDYTGDRNALFALSVAHRRAYAEAVAAGKFEVASQLVYAPDRSVAFVRLAEAPAVEREERLYYLKLAVRENGLLWTLPPEQREPLLEELAAALEGAERRFVLNRLHALRGEEFEEGEEAAPSVELPDLRAALDAGDIEAARATMERARNVGLFSQVDRQAREWFRDSKDPRAALAVLEAIGSDYTLTAALRVMRGGAAEDLIAVAPILSRRSVEKWEVLCRDGRAAVRDAAALAAKEGGSRAHLRMLAELCADKEGSVRLSAFVAFRDIEPKADETGYDPAEPTDEALAAVRKLAAR